MFLSPLVLWLAWYIMISGVRDAILADNSHWLILWAMGAIALGFWQFRSRSMHLISLRKVLLGLAFVATLGAAAFYVFAGLTAHAQAEATAPERTFEISERRASGRHGYTVTLHQRSDGTLIEGGFRQPLPYGSKCALAQRLAGNHGFVWVRVLDRSRSPERGGLNWAIRREECFSNMPLSSLPR